MTTTFEKLSSNKVKLSFVVEPEKFEQGIKKAYQKMVKKVNIPGFRRGKAPMKVIENYYGEGVFYEEAFDAIFPEIYQEALKEHNVEVVDRPDLEVQEIGRGKELKFTVEVFVRPDVTLGAYKNLGIVKTVDEVTEDDVKADIERARDRASRWVEVTDRAAKLDDQVNINYAGFLGEEQFQGGTADNHDLVLGSGAFIPGFEDQLVDKVPEEPVTVHVTFPTEYHAPDLAGKAAEFRCTIHEIRVKSTYEMDDTFAKEVGGCDTLEEMQEKLKQSIQAYTDERGEMDLQDRLLRQAAATLDYTVDPEELEKAVQEQLKALEAQLAQQGLNLQMYCAFMKTTEEDLRKDAYPAAEAALRNFAAVDKIVELEKLQATESEIGEAIALIARQNKLTVEELQPYYNEEFEQSVIRSVLTTKVMQLIRDAAIITNC